MHILDDAINYPLIAAIQEISGRIGRTTGRGIAGNIAATILRGYCTLSSVTRYVSVLKWLMVSLFDPIQALFWSAVINGVGMAGRKLAIVL